jgi:hypothetical protein
MTTSRTTDLPALIAFLRDRNGEESRRSGATGPVIVLVSLLNAVDTAQGTLDRFPTPYAQGVLEGLRQCLCIHAAIYHSGHPEWREEWSVVVKSDG